MHFFDQLRAAIDDRAAERRPVPPALEDAFRHLLAHGLRGKLTQMRDFRIGDAVGAYQHLPLSQGGFDFLDLRFADGTAFAVEIAWTTAGELRGASVGPRAAAILDTEANDDRVVFSIVDFAPEPGTTADAATAALERLCAEGTHAEPLPPATPKPEGDEHRLLPILRALVCLACLIGGWILLVSLIPET